MTHNNNDNNNINCTYTMRNVVFSVFSLFKLIRNNSQHKRRSFACLLYMLLYQYYNNCIIHSFVRYYASTSIHIWNMKWLGREQRQQQQQKR